MLQLPQQTTAAQDAVDAAVATPKNTAEILAAEANRQKAKAAERKCNAGDYVEYVLVGTGHTCRCTGAAHCFLLQTRQGYPSVKLRPKHWDQPIPGITAGVGEQQICTIHTRARSRNLTHLPKFRTAWQDR